MVKKISKHRGSVVTLPRCFDFFFRRFDFFSSKHEEIIQNAPFFSLEEVVENVYISEQKN